MDAFFPNPFLPFILHSFIPFFVQEIIRGHCPDVVTNGDSVTYKYFYRNEKAGS
jgi:hypothetical protein